MSSPHLDGSLPACGRVILGVAVACGEAPPPLNKDFAYSSFRIILKLRGRYRYSSIPAAPHAQPHAYLHPLQMVHFLPRTHIYHRHRTRLLVYFGLTSWSCIFSDFGQKWHISSIIISYRVFSLPWTSSVLCLVSSLATSVSLFIPQELLFPPDISPTVLLHVLINFN